MRFYGAKPGPNLTFRLLRRHGQHFFFLPFFFPILFIYVRSCLSPPSSRNADPGSHSRLFSPLPTTVRALHFYREKSSALSSLVDSRRIVLTHARRSKQLILSYFCKIENAKSHHGGIRTPGSTLLIVLVAFEG